MLRILIRLCFAIVTLPLVAEESTERIFTALYATGAFGSSGPVPNHESFSSRSEEILDTVGRVEDAAFLDEQVRPNTAEESKRSRRLSKNFRGWALDSQFLQSFIQTHKIESVLDAGCGDWAFSKAIDWGGARYVGIDIVKPVIEQNQTLFSSSRIGFIHGDINEMELPAADLLLCKDVLQYLPNRDVKKFLNKIGKFKYCLIINDALPNSATKMNRTIVCGDHRPLDLRLSPFHVEGATIFSYLGSSTEKSVFLIVNKPEQKEAPTKKRCFAINAIHPYQGFFSVFLTVINYLDLYDRGDIDGLVVDFKNHGLYYSPAHGFNWWNYYFEPLKLGTTENVEIEYSAPQETGRIAYLAEIGMSRKRLAELIKKYIRVKPEFQKVVDQFASEKFRGQFTIGIHYRGTDKKGEANRVCYEMITMAINKFIGENQIKEYQLFVATDEEPFLHYMQKTFEGKVLFQEASRSSSDKPIHFKNESPYRAGKEALIDCLLLSRCNHLIRTSSCLSLVSTYFNPDLSEVLLNERTRHCYKRF